MAGSHADCGDFRLLLDRIFRFVPLPIKLSDLLSSIPVDLTDDLRLTPEHGAVDDDEHIDSMWFDGDGDVGFGVKISIALAVNRESSWLSVVFGGASNEDK